MTSLVATSDAELHTLKGKTGKICTCVSVKGLTVATFYSQLSVWVTCKLWDRRTTVLLRQHYLSVSLQTTPNS